MDPEISRRCPECGASIKLRASACPQCGHTMAKTPPGTTGPENAEKEIRITPKPRTRTRLPANKQMETARKTASSVHQPSKTASNVHQTTIAPANVLEDKPPARVEKERQVSSVVLDEAGYDSGARFMLVAAVSFVLFLVLLLLSKWLG